MEHGLVLLALTTSSTCWGLFAPGTTPTSVLDDIRPRETIEDQILRTTGELLGLRWIRGSSLPLGDGKPGYANKAILDYTGFPSKTRCSWIPPVGDFILATSNACARSAERAPGFPRVILVSLTTSQVCRAASGWDRHFQLYPWPHTKRSGEVRGTTRGDTRCIASDRMNLDPFMIHETFLCLTETAFGSHPCRVVSVTYRKLRPFHGGNTGSNPVGTPNLTSSLSSSQEARKSCTIDVFLEFKKPHS